MLVLTCGNLYDLETSFKANHVLLAQLKLISNLKKGKICVGFFFFKLSLLIGGYGEFFVFSEVCPLIYWEHRNMWNSAISFPFLSFNILIEEL